MGGGVRGQGSGVRDVGVGRAAESTCRRAAAPTQCRARAADDQRRIDAPQRSASRRATRGRNTPRRPRRFGAKHGDLRRVRPRLVPLSAEIDGRAKRARPTTVTKRQHDRADDEPPAAGDAVASRLLRRVQRQARRRRRATRCPTVRGPTTMQHARRAKRSRSPPAMPADDTKSASAFDRISTPCDRAPAPNRRSGRPGFRCRTTGGSCCPGCRTCGGLPACTGSSSSPAAAR